MKREPSKTNVQPFNQLYKSTFKKFWRTSQGAYWDPRNRCKNAVVESSNWLDNIKTTMAGKKRKSVKQIKKHLYIWWEMIINIKQ